MNLEYVTLCPICNGTTFQNFITARDYTTTQEEFQIQKCSTCNFLLTNPRPSIESISRYYASDNYISHSGKSNLFGNIYRLARNYTLKNKYKLIQHYHPAPGKILDYGCGTGEFLKFLHGKKWNVIGVEPSDLARDKSNKLLEKTMYKTIGELKENQFNSITLWHVLEHIQDLNETLDTLKKLLSNDGVMFIAVPNPSSPDCHAYKNDWAAYDVPRHLWHFTRETMNILLNKHGLKIVEIKPMKLDAYYVSLLSEGYKNPGYNKLINGAKAFIGGLRSNLKASKSGEYSSLIYIVKPQ
jgi:2-polyprenyl-3-methyl-5-hydroxy-6-metoxy-1,4-benzoquinol methylase